jgi:phage tail-like protein
MARSAQKDPLDKFRWAVSVEGFTRLGFTGCEVPSVTIGTKSYAEGGAHLYPRKIVDSVEYSPVTLTRGVTLDKSFHDWASKIFELIKGMSAQEVKLIQQQSPLLGTPSYERPAPVEYRREVKIHHLDRQGRIIKTYILHNAFPIEYKPASDFASDGDDTLSMEKLVLTYESFEVVTNSKDTNPFDATDIVKRLIKRL